MAQVGHQYDMKNVFEPKRYPILPLNLDSATIGTDQGAQFFTFDGISKAQTGLKLSIRRGKTFNQTK